MKKILIIDDSPIARRILKKCFPSDLEYECFEASDGLQGLEAYKKNPPDLIFLDLTMPVMDGFHVLDEIKKLNPEARVIVVTADIQEKVRTHVMEAGALLVLQKPPSKETVSAAIYKTMDE